MSADIDTKDMLKIEKDLTLCLNGHSIKLEQAETNANTPVICWSEDKNATFTLTDCEPAGTAGTITHKSGKYGGGVNAYGTFNMYGGSVTIKAPTNLTYDGKEKHATVVGSGNWKSAFLEDIAISY